MNRPHFEVADVLRRYGDGFMKAHPQPPHVCSVINLIKICRTAALDGHLDRCPDCGYTRPSYNSCRNRHCPKCQTVAKQQWLEKRKDELLNVPYFHCVFTLPHELNPLILQNKAVMLGLLFQSVNETLTGFARDPKWKLEGQPGFIAILHTWNQELRDHFHLHVILPAGVLRGTEFIRSPQARFLFPVRALGNVFAAKYRDHLRRAFEKGELEFHGQLKPLAEAPAFKHLLNSTKKRKSWNVYAKCPFGGPAQVLDYLGRYTHRVAINNHRIKNIANGKVTFTARNRKKDKTYRITLEAPEFIRRFLLHILPPGFMKIRFYGFLSHTNKKQALALIRTELNQPHPEPTEEEAEETPTEKILRLTGLDIAHCPQCGGKLYRASLPLPPRPP
jgi:hypothetical protein